MARDIEAVIAIVRQAHPTVQVSQLRVLHPGADDDGIWFFTVPGGGYEIQIESFSGNAPFLAEDHFGERYDNLSLQDAAAVAVRWLSTGEIKLSE